MNSPPVPLQFIDYKYYDLLFPKLFPEDKHLVCYKILRGKICGITLVEKIHRELNSLTENFDTKKCEYIKRRIDKYFEGKIPLTESVEEKNSSFESGFRDGYEDALKKKNLKNKEKEKEKETNHESSIEWKKSIKSFLDFMESLLYFTMAIIITYIYFSTPSPFSKTDFKSEILESVSKKLESFEHFHQFEREPEISLFQKWNQLQEKVPLSERECFYTHECNLDQFCSMNFTCMDIDPKKENKKKSINENQKRFCTEKGCFLDLKEGECVTSSDCSFWDKCTENYKCIRDEKKKKPERVCDDKGEIKIDLNDGECYTNEDCKGIIKHIGNYEHFFTICSEDFWCVPDFTNGWYG